jgi:hypothetical protein
MLRLGIIPHIQQ